MSNASTTPKLRACDRCAFIKQVCDREGKSSCSRCTRLELQCVITRVHKPMGRPRKNRPSNIPAQTEEHYQSILSTSAVDTESVTRFSDSDTLSDGTITFSPVPSPVVKLSLPRTKRVQRTRSGCVTCKQRRKKCDEAQPVCGDCTRLGLVCRRSPAPARPSLNSQLKKFASKRYRDQQRTNSLFALSSFYGGCTSQEQHLLQHYAQVVARSLSVVPDECNDFLSMFIPMAIDQPAIRNALLALSATHLKRLHDSFEYVAIEYQAKALNQAHELLQIDMPDASTHGLAAILFLCMQENQICEGNSRKWELHLEAAVTIINNKGGPTAFPASVNFLIEAVAYFDSIATLSLSKTAFLDQQFYVPRDPNLALPAHALFGTAHTLFSIIADISQLANVESIRYISPAGEHNFRAMAAELELQLQEWTPAECSSITSDDTLAQKVTAAAIMLQWAALIRLHQIVEGNDVHHPKVRVGVSNILAALDTIPEGDLVESMLVFPMCMAGIGAITVAEKATIRRRFTIMGVTIGFGNVFEAHQVVERIWARMDIGEDIKWEQVVDEEGGTLIMS